jgi:hypothetical protein
MVITEKVAKNVKKRNRSRLERVMFLEDSSFL